MSPICGRHRAKAAGSPADAPKTWPGLRPRCLRIRMLGVLAQLAGLGSSPGQRQPSGIGDPHPVCAHRHGAVPAPLSRAGCSRQFGRASAPTMPHRVQTMRGPNGGTGTWSEGPLNVFVRLTLADIARPFLFAQAAKREEIRCLCCYVPSDPVCFLNELGAFTPCRSANVGGIWDSPVLPGAKYTGCQAPRRASAIHP
jgi:hypothetical protein